MIDHIHEIKVRDDHPIFPPRQDGIAQVELQSVEEKPLGASDELKLYAFIHQACTLFIPIKTEIVKPPHVLQRNIGTPIVPHFFPWLTGFTGSRLLRNNAFFRDDRSGNHREQKGESQQTSARTP